MSGDGLRRRLQISLWVIAASVQACVRPSLCLVDAEGSVHRHRVGFRADTSSAAPSPQNGGLGQSSCMSSQPTVVSIGVRVLLCFGLLD